MSAKTPNPTDKYVGNRIHMRRLLVGMSQQALGEELGLTFQQVQTFLKEYEVITEGQRSRIWVEGHGIRLRLQLVPFFGRLGLSAFHFCPRQSMSRAG